MRYKYREDRRRPFELISNDRLPLKSLELHLLDNMTNWTFLVVFKPLPTALLVEPMKTEARDNAFIMNKIFQANLTTILFSVDGAIIFSGGKLPVLETTQTHFDIF
mmetsp:Transcript_9536/g.10489  ORF Transcript_9536/g.10489 Transcript_9536/m.10489 type:complete len:106 (+) Transcript_9536:726-1043(+)